MESDNPLCAMHIYHLLIRCLYELDIDYVPSSFTIACVYRQIWVTDAKSHSLLDLTTQE